MLKIKTFKFNFKFKSFYFTLIHDSLQVFVQFRYVYHIIRILVLVIGSHTFIVCVLLEIHPF